MILWTKVRLEVDNWVVIFWLSIQNNISNISQIKLGMVAKIAEPSPVSNKWSMLFGNISVWNSVMFCRLLSPILLLNISPSFPRHFSIDSNILSLSSAIFSFPLSSITSYAPQIFPVIGLNPLPLFLLQFLCRLSHILVTSFNSTTLTLWRFVWRYLAAKFCDSSATKPNIIHVY